MLQLLTFSGHKLWKFSKFNSDCTTGQWKALSGDRDQKDDVTEACSQMVLQLHNIYDSDKIKMKIKVISGTLSGEVVAQAKKTQTEWIVFFRNLKKEAKVCMEELECNVVVMKKTQPQVLCLNLNRITNKKTRKQHFLFTNSITQLHRNRTHLDHNQSPKCNPITDHDWDTNNIKTDMFLEEYSDSDSDSENTSLSPSTSLFLSSSDEYPKSHNLITNAVCSKFSELEKQIKTTAKTVQLTRPLPPNSPSLCSICQHKAPVFGKPPKWSVTWSLKKRRTECADGQNKQGNCHYNILQQRGALAHGCVAKVTCISEFGKGLVSIKRGCKTLVSLVRTGASMMSAAHNVSGLRFEAVGRSLATILKRYKADMIA
ncbi:hypothetical protein M8C21_012159 [Ambrosia artemisiifolia]|uniref:Uncharacterized protein n=1 Tax=Ambrosia artemisiifolia TaxID=4212 RepID=A0AAD5BRD4_AMBAR|nr:hypothetical protein M8C21_012159 [Ambrosia artemisiifolia]